MRKLLFIAVVLAVAYGYGQLASAVVDDARPPSAAPEQTIIQVGSPLYNAEIDCQKHVCVRLTCRVRAEDVAPKDHRTNRDWFLPEAMETHCLEDADYVDSGYDRGHLRALLWSAGSDHWQSVNCLAVIVPQPPAINRGAIRELEEDIAELAVSHGYCDVQITCLFERVMLPMENADETHTVPSGFHYLVVYPGGAFETTIQADDRPLMHTGVE